MQSPLTTSPKNPLSQLKFAPDVESSFQMSYYSRMRSRIRFSLYSLAGLSVFALVLLTSGSLEAMNVSIRSSQHVGFGVPTIAFGLAIVFNFLLLAFSFHSQFPRYWQPSLVGATWLSLAAPAFFGNITTLGSALFYVALAFSRHQRLQLRWLVVELLGMVVIGVPALIVQGVREGGGIANLVVLFLLVSIVPLYWTYKVEWFERSEFWTKYLLAQDRNDERQKREQTEQMLHVLSQAIGGIVHDLGNPLTAVQGGADTLLMFVKDSEPDKATVQEFAEMISDGAQMLNFLRLSLMEQTRVLEGKPVPVELKPASLHSIVKAGAHYQKPRFSSGRTVSLSGEEIEVCVDEMRFITVFMNLIGNALKYSDGEVRVSWRLHEEGVLVAVLDQGIGGQGISQAQAEKLFVPFGRLDTHAQIEGTGLGLLSVRKIAEAHGGEVYIEGYGSRTQEEATFCTAQGRYPSLLEDGFRTAFVTACPLKVLSRGEV